MLRTALSLSVVPGLFSISACHRDQTPAPFATQLARLEAKLSDSYPANQPGAAVWLVVDGKVIFKKGYGLANIRGLGNLRPNLPIQPDMAFRIGSITKQFTAAAIMKLVEDGKLEVRAPVSRYLDKLPATWKSITVEQLLTHTSGLHNYTDIKDAGAAKDVRFKPTQLLEASVYELPLDFEPGTQYRYSNTGYILLGMLIEKVSGQSYPEFLQERLLKPLGLKHTHYDSDTETFPDLPSGYVPGPAPAPSWSVTSRFSAGGLVSTAEDLACWTQALHDGKVVKPESLARMLTPARLKQGKEEPYGYGLAFRQSQGHRLVGHGGRLPGFLTYLEADPQTRAVAVVLSNTTASEVDDQYIARQLLALAAGNPLPEPVPVAIEPSKLSRLTGLYTLEGQLRTISFEGGKLFSRLEGYPQRELIPLSETEFKVKDSDLVVRFELVGKKVLGFHRRYAEEPETPLHKLLEPIKDPGPKVTN